MLLTGRRVRRATAASETFRNPRIERQGRLDDEAGRPRPHDLGPLAREQRNVAHPLVSRQEHRVDAIPGDPQRVQPAEIRAAQLRQCLGERGTTQERAGAHRGHAGAPGPPAWTRAVPLTGPQC